MDGDVGYFIRGLVIENFKRVVAVNIDTDRNIVELRGRNEQGKSSIIDAIWAALGGLRVSPEKPIRSGAESARIVVTLSPTDDDGPEKRLIVTRTYAAGKKPTLTVKSGSGWRSQQQMLDTLLGALAFDPLMFSRLKPADRLAELAKVSGLDLAKIKAIGERRQEDYDNRHDLNRDAERYRGQLSGIQYPKDLPERPVDIEAINAQVQRIVRSNTELAKQRAERQHAVQEIAIERAAATRKRDEADQLRHRAELLDEEAEALETSIAGRQQKLDALPPIPEPGEPEPLLDKLAKAHEINRYIQERQRREELVREAEALEAKAKALTESIAARDAEKAALVAAAKMPIPDLTVQDGDVLLGGVPWDQASQAQKINASTAIAMAANPKLRIVCVRDGSLLDKEHLEMLSEMCRSRGYQLWIEITDNDAQLGFIIEDGTARAAGAPAEQTSLALA